MATLPKNLVIFYFNLCASLYIGIGGYGMAMGLGSRLLQAREAAAALT